MYIFPISVNYERLFEIKNIADAMVSSKMKQVGLLDIKRKMDIHKGHKFGRSYLMFGKTISLRDYFS